MRNVSRERAKRVLDALVGSDLPRDKVRELGRLLTSDPRFASELSELIEQSAQIGPKARTRSKPAGKGALAQVKRDLNESILLVLLAQKNFSKRQAEAFLGSLSADLLWLPRASWGLEQLVRAWTELAPPDLVDRAIGALRSARAKADPYLAGISEARERKRR